MISVFSCHSKKESKLAYTKAAVFKFWFCCKFKKCNVFFLYRWNSQMRCAPKLVYPSQDQQVRMVVSRWLTSVQDYPWASAWLISPDHVWASALQSMDTHHPFPSESEWKCVSTPVVTKHHGWSSLIFNMEFSQLYLSEDPWSRSLSSSLAF